MGGPTEYDPLNMFKAILLGQWHNLSDPGLEKRLRGRFDFMAFTGFDMCSSIPDETTMISTVYAMGAVSMLIYKTLGEHLTEAVLNHQVNQNGSGAKSSQKKTELLNHMFYHS